jgi:hypothetical protein
VSDTTGDHSSTEVGNIKISIYIITKRKRQELKVEMSESSGMSSFNLTLA